MAATLAEIARLARVSVATVSRALNDQPGVGPRVRKRIQALAARMAYTPHANARALVTGRIPFLGLVVPDITNPFFPSLARGAEEEAFARGYSLLLLDTNWSAARLRQSFDLLTSRRVAGLMISVPIDGPGEERRDWSVLARTVVMAGVPAPEGSGIRAVDVDDREGGRLVGRHLLQRGWRRIAFVAGSAGNRSALDRLAGLQEALAEAGSPDALGATSSGEWSEASGYDQARRLLALPDRPDAIFAANDLLALGVARAAHEARLAIGTDLGLAGYDDIDSVRWTAVPITSVSQPEFEVGREAARRLVALAEGAEADPDARLKPRLVVRASSGEGLGTSPAPADPAAPGAFPAPQPCTERIS